MTSIYSIPRRRIKKKEAEMLVDNNLPHLDHEERRRAITALREKGFVEDISYVYYAPDGDEFLLRLEEAVDGVMTY